MSVYAVASSVKRGYLTAGKKYQALCDDGALFNIIDDVGDMLICRWDDCPHLGGGVWRKIESIEKPKSADTLRDDAPALLEALELCAVVLSGERMSKQSLIEALEKARALIAKHGGGV